MNASKEYTSDIYEVRNASNERVDITNITKEIASYRHLGYTVKRLYPHISPRVAPRPLPLFSWDSKGRMIFNSYDYFGMAGRGFE